MPAPAPDKQIANQTTNEVSNLGSIQQKPAETADPFHKGTEGIWANDLGQSLDWVVILFSLSLTSFNSSKSRLEWNDNLDLGLSFTIAHASGGVASGGASSRSLLLLLLIKVRSRSGAGSRASVHTSSVVFITANKRDSNGFAWLTWKQVEESPS